MRTAFDIVKAHYDANDRRDMDGMLADIAADCRWTEMDGFPCAGTYVGPQEIFRNVFQALGEASKATPSISNACSTPATRSLA